ncbi:MAG TPA: hypothetical protein VGS20_06140 [Candidatus Acidoferrales bacterium]|nr:hypothetical protein [Candidatus Acidoferrales bacterium]
METTNPVSALRKDHEEISQFLAAFEGALKLTASGEDEARLAGLAWLREMTEKSAHLRESCRHDAEMLGSSVFLVADDTERTLWSQSLLHLERASFEFRKQLGFATTLSIDPLVAQGWRLAASFRQHMGYEEALLKRIELVHPHNLAPLGLKE